MKIFISRLPTHNYRQWIWKRDGSFLLRLYGVNLDLKGKDLYVEPIYIPTLVFSRTGNSLCISLRLKGEEYKNYFFFPYYPFFAVEHSNSISLGLEENDD